MGGTAAAGGAIADAPGKPGSESRARRGKGGWRRGGDEPGLGNNGGCSDGTQDHGLT